MKRAAFVFGVSFLVLALAGSGAAEIYRWVDAQGREHFTTDRSQVPPAYRSQAEKTQGGRLNRADARPAPRSGAEAGASDASGTTEIGGSGAPASASTPADAVERISGKTEQEWRDEVLKLRADIERYEQAAERCQESAGMRLSPGANRRAYEEEMREAESCQRASQDLDLRRRQLASLEERARRESVPPGWLR